MPLTGSPGSRLERIMPQGESTSGLPTSDLEETLEETLEDAAVS